MALWGNDKKQIETTMMAYLQDQSVCATVAITNAGERYNMKYMTRVGWWEAF